MAELLRLSVLIAVVSLAWALVRWWERQNLHASGLTPGITVITTANCVICPQAIAALRQQNLASPLRILDVGDPSVANVRVQAIPTVIVANRSSQEVLRRTGLSTVTDAMDIVDIAHEALALGRRIQPAP